MKFTPFLVSETYLMLISAKNALPSIEREIVCYIFQAARKSMADARKNEIQLTTDKVYEKWTKKTEDEKKENPKEYPQNYNDKKMPPNETILN